MSESYFLREVMKMALFKKKAPTQEVAVLPTHVAIIMDGNGRWAKKRGLPRTAGHVTGAKVFRNIVRHCEARGIGYVTVYAFSTENWKRPPEEVAAIMNLLRDYLKESLRDFKTEDIRVRFLGDRAPLSEDIRTLMEEAEHSTADKTGMCLNIALNYGGRHELTAAMRAIAQQVEEGTLSSADITEDTISAHLYTAGQPDPDLIVRPSGEHRLSNYLIWQAAYAEYVFMDDILWPDFTAADMDAALAEYARRNRRFGGV